MTETRFDSPVPAGTFKGKVVLICGHDGVIARAIGEGFRATGAQIASASPDADWPVAHQSVEPDAIKALFEDIENGLGPVDVVVFVAPPPTLQASESLHWDAWRAVNRDSVDFAFLIGTEFARRCLAEERGGDILIITANHAVGGGAGVSAHAAAASALASLVQSWTVEWLGDDIRANHIEIGHIEGEDDPAFGLAAASEVSIADSIPLGRLGSLQEVASLAQFLASPYAAYIAGASIRIDGGQWLRAGLGGEDFTPPRKWAETRPE